MSAISTKQIKMDYLAAYTVANPSATRLPDLTYAHGWWTIRQWPLAYRTKHRTRDIKNMTGVLLMRARERETKERV